MRFPTYRRQGRTKREHVYPDDVSLKPTISTKRQASRAVRLGDALGTKRGAGVEIKDGDPYRTKC